MNRVEIQLVDVEKQLIAILHVDLRGSELLDRISLCYAAMCWLSEGELYIQYEKI